MKMSSEQLEKKRKLNQKKKKALEIIKEQKTLEKTKTKTNLKKRRKRDDKGNEVDSVSDGQNLEKKRKKKKKRKSGLEKKSRGEKGNDADSSNLGRIDHEDLDRGHTGMEKEKKSKLGLKKKRRREKENEVSASNGDQIHADNEMMSHPGSRPKSDHAKRFSRSHTKESGNSEKLNAASNGTKIKIKKVKKESKRKKQDSKIAKERKIEQIVGDTDEEKVEEIPLVDEDCSRGMKKWLIKYKEDRPGLKVLQQRIDDFITAHEERQEQERKEREAQAAEGGWTVVTHLKGRKKTTDTETGVTIGSVAQAAVVDKMGKKKSKEVPIDFYRFKKREARRNEVMMLQSKFEQDKKRIQQLRAARKFRPY